MGLAALHFVSCDGKSDCHSRSELGCTAAEAVRLAIGAGWQWQSEIGWICPGCQMQPGWHDWFLRAMQAAHDRRQHAGH